MTKDTLSLMKRIAGHYYHKCGDNRQVLFMRDLII